MSFPITDRGGGSAAPLVDDLEAEFGELVSLADAERLARARANRPWAGSTEMGAADLALLHHREQVQEQVHYAPSHWDIPPLPLSALAPSPASGVASSPRPAAPQPQQFASPRSAAEVVAEAAQHQGMSFSAREWGPSDDESAAATAAGGRTGPPRLRAFTTAEKRSIRECKAQIDRQSFRGGVGGKASGGSPAFLEPFVVLARLYQRVGDHGSALRVLRHGQEMFPEEAILAQMLKLFQAAATRRQREWEMSQGSAFFQQAQQQRQRGAESTRQPAAPQAIFPQQPQTERSASHAEAAAARRKRLQLQQQRRNVAADSAHTPLSARLAMAASGHRGGATDTDGETDDDALMAQEEAKYASLDASASATVARFAGHAARAAVAPGPSPSPSSGRVGHVSLAELRREAAEQVGWDGIKRQQQAQLQQQQRGRPSGIKPLQLYSSSSAPFQASPVSAPVAPASARTAHQPQQQQHQPYSSLTARRPGGAALSPSLMGPRQARVPVGALLNPLSNSIGGGASSSSDAKQQGSAITTSQPPSSGPFGPPLRKVNKQLSPATPDPAVAAAAAEAATHTRLLKHRMSSRSNSAASLIAEDDLRQTQHLHPSHQAYPSRGTPSPSPSLSGPTTRSSSRAGGVAMPSSVEEKEARKHALREATARRERARSESVETKEEDAATTAAASAAFTATSSRLATEVAEDDDYADDEFDATPAVDGAGASAVASSFGVSLSEQRALPVVAEAAVPLAEEQQQQQQVADSEAAAVEAAAADDAAAAASYEWTPEQVAAWHAAQAQQVYTNEYGQVWDAQAQEWRDAPAAEQQAADITTAAAVETEADSAVGAATHSSIEAAHAPSAAPASDTSSLAASSLAVPAELESQRAHLTSLREQFRATCDAESETNGSDGSVHHQAQLQARTRIAAEMLATAQLVDSLATRLQDGGAAADTTVDHSFATSLPRAADVLVRPEDTSALVTAKEELHALRQLDSLATQARGLAKKSGAAGSPDASAFADVHRELQLLPRDMAAMMRAEALLLSLQAEADHDALLSPPPCAREVQLRARQDRLHTLAQLCARGPGSLAQGRRWEAEEARLHREVSSLQQGLEELHEAQREFAAAHAGLLKAREGVAAAMQQQQGQLASGDAASAELEAASARHRSALSTLQSLRDLPPIAEAPREDEMVMTAAELASGAAAAREAGDGSEVVLEEPQELVEAKRALGEARRKLREMQLAPEAHVGYFDPSSSGSARHAGADTGLRASQLRELSLAVEAAEATLEPLQLTFDNSLPAAFSSSSAFAAAERPVSPMLSAELPPSTKAAALADEVLHLAGLFEAIQHAQADEGSNGQARVQELRLQAEQAQRRAEMLREVVEQEVAQTKALDAAQLELRDRLHPSSAHASRPSPQEEAAMRAELASMLHALKHDLNHPLVFASSTSSAPEPAPSERPVSPLLSTRLPASAKALALAEEEKGVATMQDQLRALLEEQQSGAEAGSEQSHQLQKQIGALQASLELAERRATLLHQAVEKEAAQARMLDEKQAALRQQEQDSASSAEQRAQMQVELADLMHSIAHERTQPLLFAAAPKPPKPAPLPVPEESAPMSSPPSRGMDPFPSPSASMLAAPTAGDTSAEGSHSPSRRSVSQSRSANTRGGAESPLKRTRTFSHAAAAAAAAAPGRAFSESDWSTPAASPAVSAALESQRELFEEYAHLELQVVHLDRVGVLGATRPYISVLHQRGHIWEPVHTTETLYHDGVDGGRASSVNPHFNAMVLRLASLNHGDLTRVNKFVVKHADTRDGQDFAVAELAISLGEMIQAYVAHRQQEPDSEKALVFPLLRSEKNKSFSRPGISDNVKRMPLYTGEIKELPKACAGLLLVHDVSLRVKTTPALTNSPASRVFPREDGPSDCLVRFHVAGKKLDKMDALGKSDPFFQLWRLRPGGIVRPAPGGSGNDDDGSTQDDLSQYEQVYQSDYLEHTLDPKFPTFVLPSLALTHEGDYSTPLLLRMFDYDVGSSADFIGACHFSLRELMLASDEKQRGGKDSSSSDGANSLSNKRALWNASKAASQGSKYKNSGVLTFKLVDVFTRVEDVDTMADACLRRQGGRGFVESKGGPSKREAFLAYLLLQQSPSSSSSQPHLRRGDTLSSSELAAASSGGRASSPSRSSKKDRKKSGGGGSGRHPRPSASMGGGSSLVGGAIDEAGEEDALGSGRGGGGMNRLLRPSSSFEGDGDTGNNDTLAPPRHGRHHSKQRSTSSRDHGHGHGHGHSRGESRQFPLGARVDEGDDGDGGEDGGDDGEDTGAEYDEDEYTEEGEDDVVSSLGPSAARSGGAGNVGAMRSATFSFLAQRERETSYQVVFRATQLPKPSSAGFFSSGPEAVLELLADRKARGDSQSFESVTRSNDGAPLAAANAVTFPALIVKGKEFMSSRLRGEEADQAQTCLLRVWHVPAKAAKELGAVAAASTAGEVLGEARASFHALRTPGTQFALHHPATGAFAGSIVTDSAKLINATLVEEAKAKKKKKSKK